MLVLAALDDSLDCWIVDGLSSADCRTLVDAGARWLDGQAEQDPDVRAAFPRLQLDARRFSAVWRRAWLDSVHRARAAEQHDTRLTFFHAAERVSGAVPLCCRATSATSATCALLLASQL